eukprot:TRINITY_DN246_c0_g2_i1.p1 TRINITY_DN246_c0_g2~~TRINITY_DN246_c0_g2_i1.p1  ORF type:complete len:500 (+),score=103.60 TRINITY_DN246_c0_g2_i1:68-1501(+)
MAGLTKIVSGKLDGDIALEALPWYKRLNALACAVLIIPPLLFAYGVATTPIHLNTIILASVWFYLTGWGITAGYHRLWSHKSYEASSLVQALLACFGAAAFEGSARWWCRNHRAHHRYTDTDKDPYAVHKGFWYSHIGWMLIRQDTKKIGRADISDLNANPILRFQHRFYLEIALLFAYVLPLLIAGYGWGDWRGGFFFAGVGRMVAVHHSTFLINSAAHYFGARTFSTEHTARDNIWTAFLTMGEGYHNFHHEFPHDYRNGVRKWQWDPTKWLINFWAFLGLAWSLRAFPREEWRKARLQVKEEAIGNIAPDSLAAQRAKIDKQKSRYNWGPAPEALPEWTQADVEAKVKEGRRLIIFRGLVHDADMLNWMADHPGGSQIIEFWNGRDATTAMEGETYRHTKAARNVMAKLRVARYKEDCEAERGQFADLLQDTGGAELLGVEHVSTKEVEDSAPSSLRERPRKVRSMSPPRTTRQ